LWSQLVAIDAALCGGAVLTRSDIEWLATM